MNNILNKTVRDRFVAISHLTITALAKLNCLPSYTLYFYLSGKQTFKNGLAGVFDELTIYDVSKYLSEALNKKIDTTTAKYYLSKLEKNNLIKIHHSKPLIILLVQAEFSEDLKTLQEVFEYVRTHEEEFNFNIHHKRANQFYQTFNLERLELPQAPTTAKETALDTLIKSRPTRALPSHQEQQEAKEWRETIGNEDDYFDPFSEHLNKNKKHIKIEKLQEKKYER